MNVINYKYRFGKDVQKLSSALLTMLLIESGYMTNSLVTTSSYKKAVRDEMKAQISDVQEFNLDFFRFWKENELDSNQDAKLGNFAQDGALGTKYQTMYEGMFLLTSNSEIVFATNPVNISSAETIYVLDACSNFAIDGFERIFKVIEEVLNTASNVFSVEMLYSAFIHVGTLW